MKPIISEQSINALIPSPQQKALLVAGAVGTAAYAASLWLPPPPPPPPQPEPEPGPGPEPEPEPEPDDGKREKKWVLSRYSNFPGVHGPADTGTGLFPPAPVPPEDKIPSYGGRRPTPWEYQQEYYVFGGTWGWDPRYKVRYMAYKNAHGFWKSQYGFGGGPAEERFYKLFERGKEIERRYPGIYKNNAGRRLVVNDFSFIEGPLANIFIQLGPTKENPRHEEYKETWPEYDPDYGRGTYPGWDEKSFAIYDLPYINISNGLGGPLGIDDVAISGPTQSEGKAIFKGTQKIVVKGSQAVWQRVGKYVKDITKSKPWRTVSKWFQKTARKLKVAAARKMKPPRPAIKPPSSEVTREALAALKAEEAATVRRAEANRLAELRLQQIRQRHQAAMDAVTAETKASEERVAAMQARMEQRRLARLERQGLSRSERAAEAVKKAENRVTMTPEQWRQPDEFSNQIVRAKPYQFPVKRVQSTSRYVAPPRIEYNPPRLPEFTRTDPLANIQRKWATTTQKVRGADWNTIFRRNREARRAAAEAERQAAGNYDPVYDGAENAIVQMRKARKRIGKQKKLE